MNFGGKTQYGMTKTTPVTVIRQSPERKDLQRLLARESMRKKWISPQDRKWSSQVGCEIFFLNLILTWAHVLKICKTITWHKLVFCSCTPPIPPFFWESCRFCRPGAPLCSSQPEEPGEGLCSSSWCLDWLFVSFAQGDCSLLLQP